MGNVKQVLRERWYAWEDARKLANTDPSIYTNPENELIYDEDLDEDFQELDDAAELEALEESVNTASKKSPHPHTDPIQKDASAPLSETRI
jgi:hypothetical protein